MVEPEFAAEIGEILLKRFLVAGCNFNPAPLRLLGEEVMKLRDLEQPALPALGLGYLGLQIAPVDRLLGDLGLGLGGRGPGRRQLAIAAAVAATAPRTFTTKMGEENRKRRIFIDFHRNARGATAAAPYSLRARTNLPASAPLNWADLESVDAPEDLNYSSLPGLLATFGDPWAEMSSSARELPAVSTVKE